MSVTILTDSDYDPIFKENYLKLADNLYNSYDNFFAMHKKTYGTLGGKTSKYPVEVTFGGGVGASTDGTLPEANNTAYLNPELGAKRNYGRIEIDGLTIESSKESKHAFVRAIDQETTGKLRSFNRNMARQMFNDGTGILGQFSGNAGGTASAPTVTILTTGNYRRRKAHFEKGDYVNVNTLTSVFAITSYVHSTGVLTLSRISGSDDLTGIGAGTHSIYMQNSKDAECYGYLGLANNSTHYGQAEEFRWEPFSVNAASAPISTDMFTELAEDMDSETDEYPTVFVLPPVQYKKFLQLLEDQKIHYTAAEGMFKPRKNAMISDKFVAKIGWNGIQYQSGAGPIKIMKNKFVRDDMVWAVNLNHQEICHVKKPGWASRDNTVFLRRSGNDSYEARYVCYSEFKLNPFHVGYIYDLDIT